MVVDLLEVRRGHEHLGQLRVQWELRHHLANLVCIQRVASVCCSTLMTTNCISIWTRLGRVPSGLLDALHPDLRESLFYGVCLPTVSHAAMTAALPCTLASDMQHQLCKSADPCLLLLLLHWGRTLVRLPSSSSAPR